MAEVEARAAHNVLEACAQVETIDKVIFTSSVTAVIWRDDHASSESDFNETHWSNVNLCRKYKVKIYRQWLKLIQSSFIYLVPECPCLCTAMAWIVQDTGGEGGVGPGDGQGREHGNG